MHVFYQTHQKEKQTKKYFFLTTTSFITKLKS